MKYEWMSPISILLVFTGGYNLFDNVFLGIILIVISFLIIIIQWNLQDKILKSEEKRGED